MPIEMSAPEFCEIGSRLFGERWIYRLSIKFDISTKTIGRYASGKKPIPEAIAGIMHFMDGGTQ